VRINHHLSEPTLLAYATGQLAEGLSLAAATHLAWCGRCRDAVNAAETVGGVLLSQSEPAECSGDLLTRTLKAVENTSARCYRRSIGEALPRTRPIAAVAAAPGISGGVGHATLASAWAGDQLHAGHPKRR
jgi:putative transcriptional regulator